MPFVYDFDSMALVLRQAEPVTIKGAWNVIKEGLIKSGEIVVNSGVVQKVMSITKTASTTETAGQTLSALCAMEVTEAEVAGATVTTLTPKAAVAFTPKTVALSAIAGAVGLDLGYRVGQNLVNLYFGDGWDWNAPGIYDAAKDAIRTYITADGKTYYDEETIEAIANRLNEIGAFSESFEPEQLVKGKKVSFLKNLYYNPADSLLVGVKNVNTAIAMCMQRLIAEFNLADDFYKRTLTYFGVNQTINNGKKEIIIKINTVFLKNSTSVGYLYDYDMYVSSKTNNNELNTFNEILSSNLGNALNPTEYVSVYFDKPSVTDKYLVSAYHSARTYDMGINWDTGISSSGTLGDDFFIQYTKESKEHVYFPLGTLVGMQGVTKQQGAVIPTTFPLDIVSTFTDWIAEHILNPDGTISTYPVAIPDVDVDTYPQAVAQEGVNDDAETNENIKDAIESVPDVADVTPAPKPPKKDEGETPTPPIPAVGVIATGFVAIYNPTQSQLSAFSRYLWSNDFIENFKKLFANPMDAIIGLHMIYATPSRGTDSEIVCGYAHSGVTSKTVSNQYIELDCGSIKVNRYFGNVLDYSPYTVIQVYLPFVGIVDLDVNEIMNGTLNIKYRIDVLTGSCLARLKVTRGDYKAELYNFAGNCAVQLPISGGSYSSIIANAIGVAGSIGATIASGGTLAPVLIGSAVSSAINSHVNVSHSGSLGSNAGALGIMKPYLIITRPKPAEADNYNKFYGIPSNKTVKLSSCKGYTRVKDVHVENINATDNELSEIEQLLKEGVIL